jgi:hypothetical protein
MVKIEGEFGTVSTIGCLVGVPDIVYIEDEVSADINKHRHFNYGYPENCPRVTNSSFDPEKELGCPGSIIEFSEVGLSLINRTGEVSSQVVL